MSTYETQRKRFEDKVFNARFISSIVRTGKGGPFELVSQDCPMQDEFVKRRDDGSDLYVDDHLNAAWWGWCAALGLEKPKPEDDEL